MKKATIAVIGGSGLYDIDGVEIIDKLTIKTPWGKPSDEIIIAKISEKRVAFLPRHGRGHVLLPHEVNSRANIAALKMIGVEEIIAFSAVGSLREEIHPLDFVLPHQAIDRTKGRETTFFGNGIAAHIAFAEPFCGRLQSIIKPAADEIGLTMHTGKTLVCMEGPAFSTRAESHLYRSWGADIINMSSLPEAKLAREAEICYAVICMSTDYDCWHEEEEHVSVDMVIKNLMTNSENAKNLLKSLIGLMGDERDCSCRDAVKNSIITAPEKSNPRQARILKKIFPDYF